MNSFLVFAAEEGAENGFWLPHDIKEVFWGTLAFLIVVALLWKFAKKPGSEYFSKRTTSIAESLDEAAGARAQAEAERDGIKAALADSDAEAARIVEEARRSADALRTDIAARAERDVALVHERAEIDLAATRSQTEAELAGELSRLALGAAEKVVDEELDDSGQQRLIDTYINNIGGRN
ncbi:MAG: F0F1 ATP synthase subunit B [Microthrixaceae bacterium]